MKPLIEIDAASLKNILRAKVAGAWLLHRLLKDDPLDFFVLFSSFSSLISSPQLGSYTAANAFMDALAHHRHAQNLPALAVNWGFWSNVGMASRYLRDGRALLRGVGTFTPAQGLDVLGQLMNDDSPQIGVMRVDWKIWAKLYPTYSKSPLLSDVLSPAIAEVPGQPAQDTSDIRESILSAEPDARRQVVATYLQQQAARTLRISPAKLDVERSLTAMGLDSLMAVELRNRIQNDLGVTVPIVALLKGPSVAELSRDLTESVMASESDWEILKI